MPKPWTPPVGGGSFEIPEPGRYMARCSRLIDLGTHRNELYGGYRHRLMISWVLLKSAEGNSVQTSEGQNFEVAKFYTLSLNERANLRQDIGYWRGEPLDDDDIKEFDLYALLNQPAVLKIEHKEKKNGDMRAVVGKLTRPKEGMQVPELPGKPLAFNLEEPDWDVFKELSENLQDTIKDSREYQGIVAEQRVAQSQKQDDDDDWDGFSSDAGKTEVPGSEDDDIPW